MKHLYHADMYRFDRPQPSLWEQTADELRAESTPLSGDEHCDVAVIGAGYTGLSAAYHLTRDYQLDVRVLEAGHVGWGASGRNAGFCGIGATSLTVEQMLRVYGIAETRRFYHAQIDAVELVRQIVKDEDINADVQGEAELEVAPSRRIFRQLQAHARIQRDLLGLDNCILSAQEFRTRYFDSTELHGAVVQRPAFSLHPLRYLLGLAAAAEQHGATLHASSEVLDWSRQGNRHVLATAGGRLRASHVIFATNGFMPEHLHPSFSARPLPVISAIVVTRPLTNEELEAQAWRTANPAISSRRLLNYYRLLPDRRMLFGGRGHATGSDEGAGKTYDALERRFRRLWPNWKDVAFEYRWHGLICITRRLTPSVGRLADDPSVLFAWGFHGNGVNTATWSGKILADWLVMPKAGHEFPGMLPATMRGLAPRFPFKRLRRHYLQARLALFQLQDMLDRL